MMQESMAGVELEDNTVESELKEQNGTATIPEELYLPLGKPKRVGDRPIATAFTVPDNLPPITLSGIAIAWTRDAIAVFAEIQKTTRSARRSDIKNLPYASLRGLLEVNLTEAARIDSGIGLNRSYFNTKSTFEPEPFAYLNDSDEAEICQRLRSILNDWITHYLKPFTTKEEVSAELLERLEDLWDRSDLLKLVPFQSQVLPWSWDQQTGTTQPKDKNAYRSLADYAARLIAGHEIFKGLGAMRRIISSNGFSSGSVDLITKPISTSEGTFSLLISLEVVTFPSLHQPLLKIDVSKRRWVSQLGEPGYDRSNINGFVFSSKCSDRVFSFKVKCRPADNGDWRWKTDYDLAAIRSHLRLSMQPFGVQEIASGQADTESCQFLLTYRNGLSEVGKHGVKVGVPEIDKLEAFEAIIELLAPVGLKPFTEYTPVSSSRTKDDSGSRMINLPTLLGGILEPLAKGSSNLTPNYLEELADDEINQLLKLHLDLSLEQIHSGRKALQFSSKSKNQTDELAALTESNRLALRRLYPNEPLLLVIFYESELKVEVKLLQNIIRLLYGTSIEVLANRLPADTHGYKDNLPGGKLKAEARSQLRREAWQPVAKQIEARKRRTFCLIMAREFYPDITQPHKLKHDDQVNKSATRQALAAIAGSCVQFILPMNRVRSTQAFKLGDFFHRAQSALKDLLFAHSGRIDNVQEKVNKWLEDVPSENRPKEIIGLTIVCKQKGRSRKSIDPTFLPIAIRLNVETGKCEMCCAYEQVNTLAISPWSSFPDAIGFIAQISPIKLADKREVQKTRFMEFVRQIISNSVEEGAQPLVLIDSSNCVQLWGWLADVRMNAEQIDLGQQHQWMQQEWRGARLVRIRQGLAPGIIEKTERQLVRTTISDNRSGKDLKKVEPDYRIPCASSSSSLCRFTMTTETGCVAYLSPASKRLHDYARGQSCYRITEANTALKDPTDPKQKLLNAANLVVHQISENPPTIEQWPTPNPLEIVVTLRQPKDNPNQIAALVESLRFSFGHYSDLVALPAPLFFERVVRDYISEFAIGEAEEAETEQDQ